MPEHLKKIILPLADGSAREIEVFTEDRLAPNVLSPIVPPVDADRENGRPCLGGFNSGGSYGTADFEHLGRLKGHYTLVGDFPSGSGVSFLIVSAADKNSSLLRVTPESPRATAYLDIEDAWLMRGFSSYSRNTYYGVKLFAGENPPLEPVYAAMSATAEKIMTNMADLRSDLTGRISEVSGSIPYVGNPSLSDLASNLKSGRLCLLHDGESLKSAWRGSERQFPAGSCKFTMSGKFTEASAASDRVFYAIGDVSYSSYKNRISANADGTFSISQGSYSASWTDRPFPLSYKYLFYKTPLETADITVDAYMFTAASYMFNGCKSLADVTLRRSGSLRSTVDTSYMFKDCAELVTADLSALGGLRLSKAYEMFSGCTKLESVKFPSNLDLSECTSCHYMFYRCSSLKSIDMEPFKHLPATVTSMSYMFSGCAALESIDLDGFTIPAGANADYLFQNCKSLTSVDLSGTDFSGAKSLKYLLEGCASLAEVKLDGFTAPACSCYGMFRYCYALETIDLGGADFSKAPALDSIFYSCTSLKSIDMEPFKHLPATVGSLKYMFYGCESLESVDLDGFTAAEGVELHNMFQNCKSLASVDLSGADFSGAGTFSELFKGCSSLAEVKLDGFTAPACSCSSMFANCSSLTEIDLTVADFSRATSLRSLFGGCTSLAEVKLDGFTAPACDCSDMFGACHALVSVDLSVADFSKATSLGSMFSTSAALKSVNFGVMDLSQCNCDYMFRYCGALTDITGALSGISSDLCVWSSPLTAASAMVLIEGLAETTTAKTLSLYRTTYDSLTPQQIAIATSKGWTVARV